MTEHHAFASIPRPLTTFVGRDREVAELCALARREDVRLLTLTGPGGVGKTRLALAAAIAVAAAFESGGHYVPLAAIQDHRLVAPTLAAAIGVPERETGAFAERIRDARDLEALVVLDNFEHLMPAAPVLAQFLDACPFVTLLVTSRERLRLSGERYYPVAPLPVPDPEQLPSPDVVADSPAVRLFVDRAQELDPTFALTDANAAAVAAICHRLDGLPLALELAAARGPHLTPAALLARLARRLPLLTAGPRNAPERLRTMRDAIAWSFDLLSPAEQVLFRRLSIFAGGFTLDAAEAVTDEAPLPSAASSLSSALDGVASLIDKSLVRRDDSAAAEPRFDILETIREFGLEMVVAANEEANVRAVHAAYFVDLAARAAVRGPGQSDAHHQLQAELPNLRAAFAWCSEHDPSAALQLAAQLGRFWFRTGHHREGCDWLGRALAGAPDADPNLRVAALCSLGDLVRELGDRPQAERAFAAARVLAGANDDLLGEAAALTGLAALANDVSDFVAQKPLNEAAVSLWRVTGDRAGLAQALHHLAWAEAGFENYTTAHLYLREALEHARAACDDRWITRCLGSIGTMYVQENELHAARSYLEEAVQVARAAHNRHEINLILSDLGMVALALGDLSAARAHVSECLVLLRESGRRRIGVFALEGAGVLAELTGQHDFAVRLVASAQATRAQMGIPIDKESGLAPGLSEGVVPALRALSRLVAASAAIARPWSLEEALREAWEFTAASHDGSEVSGPGRSNRYGLSPRELDVLRFVVAGRTDQAIADELFISRRTASKHVAAILAKLDAASRAEAAVRAVRDGLV
jgi:predicted ATPase/DNA-binding CsgD family transcriptional regulator